MIDFPQDFFLEETRENFIIDSTMKTVWAAELEVLNEIAKICSAHHLTWYMAYGSLLGAVRHQGFIPWDDDIDIWIPRKDYQLFLQVAGQELPTGYRLRSPLLEDGYPEFQSCVTNSDSISIEPERLKKFHGCPFVVSIDVFPLDDLPMEDDALQFALFQTVRQAALMVKEGRKDTAVEEILQLIEKQCDVTIGREYLQTDAPDQIQEELISGLWGLANEIAAWHTTGEAEEVCMYLDYFKYGKKYQNAWFGNPDRLIYEGMYVPVPQNYDAILRIIYGDYMVRRRNAAAHDYPFYKKQLEQLRKYVEESENQRLQ